MGRNNADDPLVPISLRLPRSIVLAINEKARNMERTKSDIIRSMIENDTVKPLGKPRPRKRQVSVSSIKADPELVRGISLLGNNLNQLARWCNTYKKEVEATEVLFLLLSIETEMKKLILKSQDYADKVL